MEIEEKINKIRWLSRRNHAHFLLSTNGKVISCLNEQQILTFLFSVDKTVKLWKVSEREKQAVGYNLRDEEGTQRGILRPKRLVVPHYEPMELMIEASPKKVFANAHMYHINSISINSDDETYLSADDLRINLWHLEITDRSFSKYCYV